MNESNNPLYAAIDAYVEQEMRRLKIPGATLAIVDEDEITHLYGFGKTGPEGNEPTPQTTFYIGSLTKSFTALAVMQLVEAGKIQLDAPIQCYLPWFRVADLEASAQMTVRHLLNQTSGLPTSAGEIPLADFDSSPGASERQMRALAELPLTRPVGADFEYSNANYILLGLILEAASGESYADYVQKHIFHPLDMCHTYTSAELAQANGLATGYRYWFTYPVASPNLPDPHGALAGGLLISSVEDMTRYLTVHLNNGRYHNVQLLSAQGIKALHQGEANVDYMGISLGRYGMGWYDGEIGRTRLVWHSGILPHFFAYMALLPEQKKGFVLLCNADHHWMSPLLTGIGTGVAELLAGERLPEEQPRPAPVPFVGMIPWMLRGLLLIPILQIVGVLTTLRRMKDGRPKRSSLFLSLLPNLLTAFAIRPMLGKRRGYMRLYMPDIYWLSLICGSFALLWSLLRTILVSRSLKKT